MVQVVVLGFLEQQEQPLSVSGIVPDSYEIGNNALLGRYVNLALGSVSLGGREVL